MKVVYADFIQPDLDLEAGLLAEAGMTLVPAEPQCQTPEEVIRVADGAMGLLVQSAPITRAVFEALPDLRIVSVPGIGVDSVDLDAARHHGVWVANVPDANLTEVATHAVAMTLSLIRHLPLFDRNVHAGTWGYELTGPMHRPGHLTFGLVGLGRIGRLTASYAAPMFGSVVAFDPHVPDGAWPDAVTRAEDLAALFRQSDVVSLHLPLTAETQGLVSTALLADMKPGSYLVNVSRGPIVDIGALLAALDRGHLAGAALDVLPDEPPAADDPILGHPKVLLSPHAAFYSLESEEELARRSATNIVDLVRQGHPHSVVVEGRR
jgi:D-3-phosphoglycerate dehydrogenase